MALTLSGTTGVAGVDGSAGTPAVQGSDTNTGISFGTDTVSINTGGTARATVDSSGRLLVGTSSTELIGVGSGGAQIQSIAANPLSVARFSNDNFGCVVAIGKSRGASAGSYTVVQNNDLLGEIRFAGADGTDLQTVGAQISAEIDGTPGSNDLPTRLVFSTTADGASSPTERMRITNGGDFYFNTTVSTKTTDGFRVENGGIPNVARGTSGTFMQFFHSGSGSQIGSITNNGGTATAYNTSSDYRLKENIAALTDGITRLQQLKPSRFNFIVDPDKAVDGFIAHEVQAVVPEAISGEKDAVDDEGKPVYQGIDQSKLVPLLTAALQEAIAKIESLEARLTTLEGGTN